MGEPFKIIFFGSSDFSLTPLEFLLKSNHRLLQVITTPDRPQGRGLKVQANPVKSLCETSNIAVLAPEKLKDPGLEESVRSLSPDFFVLASYGKLIPGSWLKIPARGALNLHPSLLPKYRGAAPIPWQIADGVKETGVTIFEMVREMDAGDLYHQIKTPLAGDHTTESLTKELSALSARGLSEVLDRAAKGPLARTPQNPGEATYARKLAKDDGYLDWKEPAEILERKIRAFSPWPGTFVSYKNEPLRIAKAKILDREGTSQEPGAFLGLVSGTVGVQTGQGVLGLEQVQLPGRKIISGKDFMNGVRLSSGFVFGTLPLS